MPAAQSRKTLPSTSSTVAPDPRSMTSGYPRVYDGDTTVLSRAMRAVAFGPGSGVLMSGAVIQLELRTQNSELRTWNLELGTWNLELGTWNLELGTWNLELGTWNLELGTRKLTFR